ncbi:hypothetical protein N7474_010356 [Penicillium riverlandense]|uniref:uncharacterized protein n=1 Tax=Penicillium riverlandense TaxID=1903569 RepID=UPI002547F9D6|nr:uncharacterized protein N7474_010356 [Penicillium riverlandense]KAJ5806764.1 hypothetical protein N7474_010356 [Penicillium riverlandense]
MLLRAASLRQLADVNQLCLRCALRQSHASAPSFRATRIPRVAGSLRSLSTATDQPEPVSEEPVHAKSPVPDPSLSSISAEDIRLKAEFEENRDIRRYLQKWQQINPNILDPVRDPHSTDPWVGTMLNGRGASDEPWGNNLTDNHDLDPSEYSDSYYLEPGDLAVRLSATGVFTFSIYVQSIHKQSQFYTDRGNWRLSSFRELDFVVKGFAPPGLLRPLLPYFPDREALTNPVVQSVPEGGVPRPLGAPLLKMMTEFGGQVLDFYRDNSKVLDNLPDYLADEEEFRRLSLEELASEVLGLDKSELDSVKLFAIHQAVRRYPFIIERDSASLFNPIYLVQPKRIAEMITKVTTWVHEHQQYCTELITGKSPVGMKRHPMQQFIEKARRLIRLSRKVRSPTIMFSVGPSSQKFFPGQDGKPAVYREVLTESFTESDQTIVQFLQLHAIPTASMASGTLKSTGSHIMRSTGMYNQLGLSEDSTRLFLQELGVVSPWENLSILDQNVLLPGHGMSEKAEAKWQEMVERASRMPLKDRMHDLRTDWGDLPVYCVDAAATKEIDDGVSLERIPGSDDTFWVRVHVANPTAFMHPNDPIMRYAAERLTSTYVPERTYPMLPPSLSQDHFSLAAGRPTLTISAKMNLQGEILDTEIKNGTVRNIISLTHDTLRNFLNPDTKESPEYLTVGGEYVTPPPAAGKVLTETLSPEDKETFTILRQLMLAFREHREKSGAMEIFPRMDFSVSVQAGNIPMQPYEMQVNQGRYWLGDPIIRLRYRPDVDPLEITDRSKDDLISLLMNLAGHVAATFCAARHIPAIYDGTRYDPEYLPLTRENVAELNGQNYYRFAMPQAISSTTPLPHHTLGLNSYLKSTSPLRRFSDVLAHFQIERALRFEHDHGRQFNAADPKHEHEETNDPSAHLLSKSSLSNHLAASQLINSRLRNIMKFSDQHWACMLLFRAFYFGECALPESFTCQLRLPRRRPPSEGTVYAGLIANLGLRCSITIPEDCPGRELMGVFSVVDAKITSVDMASLEVNMEATRFVKAFKRMGEWA